MALYHFSVKQVSRGKGQTVVNSAAYISGQKLYNDYYGQTHDYTKKSGVVFTEILTPEYVPERLSDRETLWNEVEQIEKSKRAQLACIFRKNCASVPEERSAIPLQTEQNSAG